ncbi:MAG: MerR family transcriptional regulator [Endomicrobium sp.]|jgi:DNA-binding transcriptional MerR regulator|nr:MerR family transcriptional regulator [Endomicrobium sp.]
MLSTKKYFTISEVSKITSIPKHTLRYWEHEFSFLHPIRKKSRIRNYSEEDIKLILDIKDLLYNKHYRIEGVKNHYSKFLNKNNKNTVTKMTINNELIKYIEKELESILLLLIK